jgi:hypothetical protein
MSQLANISPAGVPQLNSLQKEVMLNNLGGSFEDFGGVFRQIKLDNNNNWALKEGGATQTIPADQLYVVLLGAAVSNHCLWWEKSYSPGQEATEPDFVWWEKDGFPANLPDIARGPNRLNPQFKHDYQIVRRLVVSIVRGTQTGTIIDWENPYALDATSMSLFGKGIPAQNFYKYGGLISLCKQLSVGGFEVYPNYFMTQIVKDPSVRVPTLLFKPYPMNGNQLVMLPPESINMAINAAASEVTQDLLKIRIKYGNDSGPDKQPQAYTQASAPAQPVQQPAPAPAAPVHNNVPTPDSTGGTVQAPATPVSAAGPAAPAYKPTATVVQSAPVQAPAPTPAAGPDVNALLAQAKEALRVKNTLTQPAAEAIQDVTVTPVTPVTNPIQINNTEVPIQNPAPVQAPAAPAAAPAGNSMQAKLANLLAQAGK